MTLRTSTFKINYLHFWKLFGPGLAHMLSPTRPNGQNFQPVTTGPYIRVFPSFRISLFSEEPALCTCMTLSLLAHFEVLTSYKNFHRSLRSITSFVVTATQREREGERVTMGTTSMASRVFLLLLIFLSSTNLSLSLYEDQVGLMDW